MEILAGTTEMPRLALLSYELDPRAIELVDAAHDELSAAILAEQNGDELWGYYPGHPRQEEVNKHPLPRCQQLHMHLDASFVPLHRELRDTHLAFIRLCTGAHYSEGLHLDADDQTAVAGDASRGGRDVFKFLMNLHPGASREFRYADVPLEELRERSGVALSRDAYSSIGYEALAGLPVSILRIPPRQGGTVFAATFLANTVPHSGNDGPEGHFLLSYAGYRDTLL